MNEVQFKTDEKGKGSFYILDGNESIAEMAIRVSGNDLTVYHTEVKPAYEGKGYAKELLKKMVAHARNNNLKVIPLCPYVHAQFKRHPDEYSDIWNKQKK